MLLASRALLMLMTPFSGVAEEGTEGLCEPLHPSLLLLALRMVLDAWKAVLSKKPSTFGCLLCPSHWLPVPGPCPSTAKFLQEDTLQQNKHCHREPEITGMPLHASPA